MKEVHDIQDILRFIDKKISYLESNLKDIEITRLEDETNSKLQAECKELENQIERWKKKKNELNELTENIIDEQVKSLTA